MRILHLCLSCFYVDGYSYQENEIVQQNIRDGHTVEVISSTETYLNGKIIYIDPSCYLGKDGSIVERLPYSDKYPPFVGRKLRKHDGLYQLISKFGPDVILFHGACGAEIATAARYIKNNPYVILYVDSHEDFVNSARGAVSKWILHWGYYRPLLRRALPWITKVLPVSVSCFEFMRDFYGVPESKLEFYPLGGRIPEEDEYENQRERVRADLRVAKDEVLIVQSGKIDASKKLIEALEAFCKTGDAKIHFVVPGLIQPDVEGRVRELADSNPRIHLLGWKTSDELHGILCAADVYCQPGTQSATMQMSLACRCAIVLDDIPSHVPYFADNGWLIGKSRTLTDAFREIVAKKGDLERMSRNSHALALELIDYRKLAARLYQ